MLSPLDLKLLRDIGKINGSGTAKVNSVPYDGTIVLIVNVKNPPLDNKLVRQAMDLAIDRQALVKNLFNGLASVPNGWIPQGDFAYDNSRPPMPYDPEKAKALVAKSGYKGEVIPYQTRAAEERIRDVLIRRGR